MKLDLLLLVVGAVATPTLSPQPLGLLSREDGGPPKISCFAPRSYAGSTFELFAAGAGVPVQSVSAAPGQHRVDFVLDGAVPVSRCYRCRYRSYNGSAWQPSAFSMEIAVNASEDAGCHPPTAAPTGRPLPTSTTLRRDRSWLLPVAVSAAGLALLLLAATAAWRGSRRRAGRRRGAPPPVRPGAPRRASAAPQNPTPSPLFLSAEFSYDNCACAVGVSAQPGAGSGAASPRRDPRASPPAAPHFSTFRSSA
ncbi:protein HIDE1 isoform X2 [Opisthocomus hoazin]|uniref:protein HIDE1 isoform X2 n=1 Tax=Opisthocomus hoazin TaxID=30419 RepID=UPI003F53C74B